MRTPSRVTNGAHYDWAGISTIQSYCCFHSSKHTNNNVPAWVENKVEKFDVTKIYLERTR